MYIVLGFVSRSSLLSHDNSLHVEAVLLLWFLWFHFVHICSVLLIFDAIT